MPGFCGFFLYVKMRARLSRGPFEGEIGLPGQVSLVRLVVVHGCTQRMTLSFRVMLVTQLNDVVFGHLWEAFSVFFYVI